jgi:TolB-like protein/Flp pilus assembly protein TadD
LSITNDGRAIAIASRKGRALLGYLALRNGAPVARSVVGALLWGERSEDQARASLRQTLSELRASLRGAPAAPIGANNETIWWHPDAAWVDAREVEAAANAEDEDVLRKAAELFAGELMEGLSTGEAAFEQWLVAERERFRDLTCTIQERLLRLLETRGRFDEALAVASRLLAIDPLRESVHRTAMRLYAALGRYDAALAQYDRCCRELSDNLQIRPEVETEELAQSIRRRRRGAEVARPAAAPVLPDKPSIAVLAFADLSPERKHEFLSEGIVEDLINALSRMRELFVISRHASSYYKGRAMRTGDMARELGVQFLLDGSVRVAGQRVRVTTQLIDGCSGAQVWADRYETEVSDLFSVQDEITRSIALALQVTLTQGESARLWEGQTTNFRAWEKMIEARSLFFRYTRVDNARARHLLEEAMRIDPNYTGAMALLGLTHWWDARFNTAIDKEASLGAAEEQIRRILALNPEMGQAYMLRGGVAFLRDRHDEAVALCERAVELAPSDAKAVAFLGLIRLYAGQSAKAVAAIKSAMRLSPHCPSWFTYNLAMAHLWLGDLDHAYEGASAYLQREPDEPLAYTNLAIVLGFMGRDSDASNLIADLKGKFLSFGIEDFVISHRYKEKEKQARMVDILRKAGLE